MKVIKYKVNFAPGVYAVLQDNSLANLQSLAMVAYSMLIQLSVFGRYLNSRV